MPAARKAFQPQSRCNTLQHSRKLRNSGGLIPAAGISQIGDDNRIWKLVEIRCNCLPGGRLVDGYGGIITALSTPLGGLAIDKVDLYCDVLRARLLSQEGLIRGYGTNAGIILSIGAAMMGAGAVILRLSSTGHVLSYVVFGVMGVVFLFNAILGTRIISPAEWRTSPGATVLSSNLGSYEYKYKRSIGDAFGQAVDCNQRVLDRKAQYLQWDIWGLIIEVVALVVLASISLWLSGQGAFPASQCPV
jgi:hypothetical protein